MSHDKSNGKSEIEFPQMRAELQYAVCALADEEFQEDAWSTQGSRDLGVTYTFDMALHTLLDDSIVADQGQAAAGTILTGNEELEVVQSLVEAARQVIAEIGLRGTFGDARTLPSWRVVVTTAQRAKSVLGSPPRFP
jgi:hypothetical protein